MGKFSQPRGSGQPQDEYNKSEQFLSDGFEEMEAPSVEEMPEMVLNEPQYVPAKKPGSSAKKNKKIILISLCSVAAVLLIGIISALAYLIITDPNDGKILNNVSVAGVNVGNMSRSEAKAAIRAATENTYTVQSIPVP